MTFIVPVNSSTASLSWGLYFLISSFPSSKPGIYQTEPVEPVIHVYKEVKKRRWYKSITNFDLALHNISQVLPVEWVGNTMKSMPLLFSVVLVWQ